MPTLRPALRPVASRRVALLVDQMPAPRCAARYGMAWYGSTCDATRIRDDGRSHGPCGSAIVRSRLARFIRFEVLPCMHADAGCRVPLLPWTHCLEPLNRRGRDVHSRRVGDPLPRVLGGAVCSCCGDARGPCGRHSSLLFKSW